MGSIFRLTLSVLVPLLAIGCSTNLFPFETDVVNNSKIHQENLKEIADIDDDILDFAQDIYASEPVETSDEHLVHDTRHHLIEDLKDPTYIDFIDTTLFQTYCDSRNGTVQSWSIKKNYERLRYSRVSRLFLTCEVEGQVDGAILYQTTRKYPYNKIEKHYLTNEAFEEYRQFYEKLVSFDGTVEIDKASLINARTGKIYESEYHPVYLIGEKAKVIGGLSLFVAGEKIDTRLIKVDPETNEAVIKTKGLKTLTVEQILTSTFDIDGQRIGGFHKIDAYESEKKPLGNYLKITVSE